MRYFLGMEVHQIDDGIFLTQKIGSLLYLTTTRSYLMFYSNLLSRFMHSPSLTHFGVSKRVLRYLKNTIDFGIWYNKSDGKVEGFVDSD
uniref:Retrovirus-related Pol polyprotein from transposon TNT 1-94 n=1 Tax=Cajanus cajan TaxID=3821 RepID=A0A151T2L3_CAJCA|nr:hypothetical protein KK1_023741 [Cajanus cajan]